MAAQPNLRCFNFLKDEEFCDFTICCQGVSFPVHRLFIAQASPYFKTVCTGPFQVSAMSRSTWEKQC